MGFQVLKKLDQDKETWLANVPAAAFARSTPAAFYQVCVLYALRMHQYVYYYYYFACKYIHLAHATFGACLNRASEACGCRLCH
jgi:hypothetical protein